MTYVRPLLAKRIDGFTGNQAVQFDEHGHICARTELHFPIYVSPKIDGIRALVPKGAAPHTRSGKPIPNLHIRKALSALRLPLDGEITLADHATHPDCFNLTQSAVMSKAGKPAFEYHTFDVLGRDDSAFAARFSFLEGYYHLPGPEMPWLRLVPHTLAESIPQLLDLEERYLAEGYEGIMLRQAFGHYKHGRSTFREQILLKLKRFVDDEAEIVGFVEQLRNTNAASTDNLGYTARSTAKEGMIPAGTLGAFICKAPKWAQTFEIGTGRGLTADFRKFVWDNRQAFLGKTCKYRFQLIGSIDRPRIPQWAGLREKE